MQIYGDELRVLTSSWSAGAISSRNLHPHIQPRLKPRFSAPIIRFLCVYAVDTCSAVMGYICCTSADSAIAAAAAADDDDDDGGSFFYRLSSA